MSRFGAVFERLWPGLVVALLTAAVVGGLSGWVDLRERMTRVESRLDSVETNVSGLRNGISDLRNDIADLRDLVIDLHLRPDDAADDD